MSDDEASAASDVLDVIDDSEVKSDDWSPVSIKQEPDLDAAATDSSSALNVTSLDHDPALTDDIRVVDQDVADDGNVLDSLLPHIQHVVDAERLDVQRRLAECSSDTKNMDGEREDLHWEKQSVTETTKSAVGDDAEAVENAAGKLKRGRRKPKPFCKLSAPVKRQRLRERKRKQKDDQKLLQLLLDSNCKREESGESIYQCCRAPEIPMIRRNNKFLCGVCLKPFIRFQKLTYHTYTHMGDWPYVCAICEKHFFHSGLLKKHMLCHDNRELFICARCKKQFTCWVQFEHHMFHQSGQAGDYKCTICERQFTNPKSLKSHMQYHENKESLACPICLKQLTHLQSLRRHVERHVSSPAEERDHSSTKQFHNVEDARGHVLIHASSDETKSVEHGITCTQLAEEQSTVDYDTKPEFTCTNCAKAFPTLDNLEDHMYLHSTTRPHRCTQCKEQFSLPASLSIHMKKHTECSKSSAHVPERRNVKSYVCGECGKTLSTQWGYKTHLFLHTGERPYKCYTCGERFALVGHLKSHIFVHHSNRDGLSYKCSVCEKEFSHPASLQNHMQYHNNKDSFACPICSKQLTSSWGLKEHIRRTHVVGSRKENRTNPRSYTCGECGKTLTSQYAYSTHVFLHTGKRPHACTVCDKTFTLTAQLRRHMDVHRSDRELFPCSECGKGLISQRALERHMTIHSGTQKHCCTECDRRFTDANSLRNHQQVHRGDRPSYVCQFCNRLCITAVGLRRHLQLHGTETPYRCFVCEARFATYHRLHDHAQKHFGVSRRPADPFCCHKCGKTLSTKQSLEYHMNTHFPDMTAVCPECGRQFTSVARMAVHVRSVHKDELAENPKHPKLEAALRYVCDDCGKRYANCNSLKQHMRRHTGDLLPCLICNKGFTDNWDLRVHMRRHKTEPLNDSAQTGEVPEEAVILQSQSGTDVSCDTSLTSAQSANSCDTLLISAESATSESATS